MLADCKIRHKQKKIVELRELRHQQQNEAFKLENLFRNMGSNRSQYSYLIIGKSVASKKQNKSNMAVIAVSFNVILRHNVLSRVESLADGSVPDLVNTSKQNSYWYYYCAWPMSIYAADPILSVF